MSPSVVNGVLGSVANIKFSLIAMVLWVIIVTIALVVIGVLSFRRWRSHYFLDAQSHSDSSGSSAADTDSELGSNLGTEMGMDSGLDGTSSRGMSNSAFEGEDAPQPVGVHQNGGASTDSNLDMFNPAGSDATRL